MLWLENSQFLLVILTNNWLFSNITSFDLKITSCRWLKENNRLLFSVTGIDNQGHSHIIGTWVPTKVPTQGPHNVLHTALYLRASYSKMSGKAGNSSWNIIFWQKTLLSIRILWRVACAWKLNARLEEKSWPFCWWAFPFFKVCVWSSKIIICCKL